MAGVKRRGVLCPTPLLYFPSPDKPQLPFSWERRACDSPERPSSAWPSPGQNVKPRGSSETGASVSKLRMPHDGPRPFPSPASPRSPQASCSESQTGWTESLVTQVNHPWCS